MWADDVRDLLSSELEPHQHSFTYTYPPPRHAELASREGGLVARHLSGWTDASIYLHVPYCRLNCKFCSLHRTLESGPSDATRYATALEAEVDLFASATNAGTPLHSAYIGGGTPTILSSQRIASLLDHVADAFDIRSRATELTVEIAPDTTRSRDQWRTYLAPLTNRHDLPITRISVGMQSPDEATLTHMGRPGTLPAGGDLLRVVDDLVPTYNIDFVVGYPPSVTGGIHRECKVIATAIEAMLKTGLRLPSVSIYQLWDVDSIPATRSRTHADLYSGGAVFSALYDLQTSLYNLGYHMGAGASFVRTDADRHEWTIHRCTAFRHLGFGSGSYSFAPSAFIQRARRIEEYVSSASSATDYDALDSDLNRYYPLTPAELEIRRAIVGLRSACTVEGLRIEVSPASDEESATLAQLDRKIQSLTELGILGRDEHGSLALSESHFLLTNAISSYLHPADVPRRRER